MHKHTCPYCGSNPVPHRFYWYNETLNIFLTPIRGWVLYNPFTKWFKQNVVRHLTYFFISSLEFFHILTRQPDPSKCKVPRAKVLWEEAERRGIVMEEYLLFGRPIDMYLARQIPNNKSQITNKYQISQLRQGYVGQANIKYQGTGTRIVFSGLPRPQGYYNPKLDVLDDKAIFKKFMMAENLPVPRGGAAASFTDAKRIFESIDHPVIVKPRAGSRGRHSTTYVESLADLKVAYAVSKQLCHWVMVEEQLQGPVYRATVINFKIQGVLRGDSPQVVGDGVHSIEQLVAVKNLNHNDMVREIKLDERAEGFLRRELGGKVTSAKLHVTSGSYAVFEYVPQKGEAIYLSEKIGVGYGGSSSEDFEICHADNKELFERAARELGDPLVGFDFIVTDITKSWKAQKCGFIEVNTLPFINLHHDPLLGKPRNVAAAVWEMVEI